MAIDFHAILPELVLAGTALLVLVVDLFVERAVQFLSDRALGEDNPAPAASPAPRSSAGSRADRSARCSGRR